MQIKVGDYLKNYTRFYLAALVCLLVYILLEVIPSINQNEITRIILLGGSCIFMYVGGIKLSKLTGNNKALKMNLWIFFIIYLILLITLTLFDPIWGRSGINNIIDTDSFDYYIEHALNLVPFKTISIYIKNLSYNVLTKENIIFNLIGNFVCMMPFALFLPLLFKSERKLLNFIKTMICIPVLVEVIQFITTSGSCDIDDVILNFTGALLFYGILSIPFIKKWLFKIFLKEDISSINKND